MSKKINATAIDALRNHLNHIRAYQTEVREVGVTNMGVGFYIDSHDGEHTKALVAFSCWPTNPEEGEAEGGWNISVRRKYDNLLVGEWVAQGERLEYLRALDADWHAAWFSVMANCSGANYWLRFVEVEEVLE